MFKKGDIVMCDDDDDHLYIEVISANKEDFQGKYILIHRTRMDDIMVGDEDCLDCEYFTKVNYDPRNTHFDILLAKIVNLEELCLKKGI